MPEKQFSDERIAFALRQADGCIVPRLSFRIG